MLHRLPGSDGFLGRLQRAQLDYVCGSEAGARSLAENYVGLRTSSSERAVEPAASRASARQPRRRIAFSFRISGRTSSLMPIFSKSASQRSGVSSG